MDIDPIFLLDDNVRALREHRQRLVAMHRVLRALAVLSEAKRIVIAAGWTR